jgi:hypothetical protein
VSPLESPALPVVGNLAQAVAQSAVALNWALAPVHLARLSVQYAVQASVPAAPPVLPATPPVLPDAPPVLPDAPPVLPDLPPVLLDPPPVLLDPPPVLLDPPPAAAPSGPPVPPPVPPPAVVLSLEQAEAQRERRETRSPDLKCK